MDWNEIEAAYVTGGGSYRNLAEKYGISISTVKLHGSRGGWVEKRRQYEEDVMERILEENKDAAARRTARLLEVGDGLLDKVQELTAATESPTALKTLTEALKNIRDAQMLKEGNREGDKLPVVLKDLAEFAA